ncbi:MAG: hypothetical protein HY593_06550 [Candidatus Omnitrophica bacterium]|nr:hypothetical protein [Candidatus Omnitrophota bacterium]
MAKGGGKAAGNLLRLSGLIFSVAGSFHVLRYFFKWEFRVGGLELTPLGSLIVGCLLLFLAFNCFVASKA